MNLLRSRERLFESIEQVSEGKTKRHDEVKEELRKRLLK